jgi:hypothetical protein
MTVPPALLARVEQYCRRQNLSNPQLVGQGKDGSVWQVDRPSAVKIHAHYSSYAPEVQAYIRLTERGLEKIAGFTVPSLIDFDDELLAIEMTIVRPPYLLDFASARLDSPPDLIEDEGHTLADLVVERFGDRAPDIFHLQQQLALLAGIHHERATDPRVGARLDEAEADKREAALQLLDALGRLLRER